MILPKIYMKMNFHSSLSYLNVENIYDEGVVNIFWQDCRSIFLEKGDGGMTIFYILMNDNSHPHNIIIYRVCVLIVINVDYQLCFMGIVMVIVIVHLLLINKAMISLLIQLLYNIVV